MQALAEAGEPEGSWLRAERQSGGRGRLGRQWESPAGNLYTSTLVRLSGGQPPAATLAMVAAVALHEVIAPLVEAVVPPRPFYELHGGPIATRAVQLKWPNDLLIGGAKVSGILLERSGDSVVVGIGVNVLHHPEGLGRPTISLAAEGVRITPPELLTLLVPVFARWVATWRSGLAPVIARWLTVAHPVGTPLLASLPDGARIEGLFGGLHPDGALMLQVAPGETRLIHAADVFLL